MHSTSLGEMHSAADEEQAGWVASGTSRQSPRTGQLMRSLTGSLKGLLGSSGNLQGMLDSSVHRSSHRSDGSRHSRWALGIRIQGLRDVGLLLGFRGPNVVLCSI